MFVSKSAAPGKENIDIELQMFLLRRYAAQAVKDVRKPTPLHIFSPHPFCTIAASLRLIESHVHTARRIVTSSCPPPLPPPLPQALGTSKSQVSNEFYVCSLSSNTIVYKGQLKAEQARSTPPM